MKKKNNHLRKLIIDKLINYYGAYKCFYNYDGKLMQDIPPRIKKQADMDRNEYNKMSDKKLLEVYTDTVDNEAYQNYTEEGPEI